MFTKKEKTKLIALALIGQQDYQWHGYAIKEYLVTNTDISKEVVYPALRELAKDQLISVELHFPKGMERGQKRYAITELGSQHLASLYNEIAKLKEEIEAIVVNNTSEPLPLEMKEGK